MPPPRKEEIARRVGKWISRHQDLGRRYPEAYEIDIRIHRVDIPDYVRAAMDEASIGSIVSDAMRVALMDFAEGLTEDYPWIRTWAQEGRSGGWLVLYTDDPVLDYEGNVPNARKAQKRLRDLSEIHRRQNRAEHAFRRLMENPDFWDGFGLPGPRRQDWRPGR